MKPGKMKLLLVCLFAAFLYCVVQAGAQSVQPAAQDQAVKSDANAGAKSSKQTSSSASEGEKRFEAQCGRCHIPPEDLSPREARAVLRQMRVRALISAEDERLILKYIAP
jgi:cytochrome c5